MKRIHSIACTAAVLLIAACAALGQRTASLADNAALRYWSAFSQLQDTGLTDQEAKELDSVLEKLAPFDLSKYDALIQKNAPALQIMARGTSLPNCDWGLDYGLAESVPVDYARKALALGRLNILYVMRLYHSGDRDGALTALAAGLRFSRDVANGGTFFPTLVAKDLIVTHLMAVDAALRMGQLTAGERSQLQKAVTAMGDGLDWSNAAKRELDLLDAHYHHEARISQALDRIAPPYEASLNDESKLANAQDAIKSAPSDLANLIPNPKRILEQKQELSAKLQQTRALLR